MPTRIKVLVFPCGSENGLEIHDALSRSIHVTVYGASSIDDHGSSTYEHYFANLPLISSSGFDEAFSKIIVENNIDLVFPTHDTVALYLSERSNRWSCTIVNGNAETARICRKKSLTFNHFSDFPWMSRMIDPKSDNIAWPIVAKPDSGQGGQGLEIIETLDCFKGRSRENDDTVYFEYLPGSEFTVDCFSTRTSELVFISPRTRERVRAGISMRSRIIDATPEIEAIANDIASRLKLHGPWFFQVKTARDGTLKLMEISIRVAGSMVAQRAAGANLPLWTVHDWMGRKLSWCKTQGLEYIDRRIRTKARLSYSYSRVYIDFDDTVIDSQTGLPIPHVIEFLYRMKASKKEIILLTRHERSISDTLAAAAISEKLFNSIILLGEKSLKKSAFVKPDSIFIDNHFPERQDVAETCGIPVFDVDGIDFL